MTPLEILLVLVALAAALGLASHAHARGAWRPRTRRLLQAHAGLALASLALLLVSFLRPDLSYAYVFDHTRTDYPLAYRVAGIWGGEEGTILLWLALVATFLSLLLRRNDPDGIHPRAALFLAAFGGALALVCVLSGGFGPTDPARLALAPQGRGMADVLLTPLMVIHPPVQFIAYALLTVLAAYVLAGLGARTSPDAWASPAYAWARWAWLAATLGLGLGALWAYYVLSFGGYWAWDPVETANLLPWLALTAFLHAGKRFLRAREAALSAPLLGYLAFLLALFATFATRSGLWVSVHAFTDPTGGFQPDAGLRLLAILDAHVPTRLFLGILTALTLAGTALFLLHHAPKLTPLLQGLLRGHAFLLVALAGAALLDPAAFWSLALAAASLSPQLGAGLGTLVLLLLGAPLALLHLAHDDPEKRAWDVDRMLGVATALLAVALGVAFLLNLQVVNRPDRLLFDLRAPFLALPLLAALTFALALPPWGPRNALLLTSAGILAALVAAFLFPERRVPALAAPLVAAATLAALARLVHAQGRIENARLRLAGLLLLLAAILGMVQWSNPPTTLAGFDLARAPVAAGMLGFTLSLLGLAGAVAAFRARGLPLAATGALAATLAAGYLVGAALAFAALALILWRSADFRPLAPRSEAVRIRETGIYLLHLAVILGMLGYAASTYAAERATFPAAALDTEGTVGGLTFHVGTPNATLDADGRVDALRIPLHLLDSPGGPPAHLHFTWEGDHYKGRLDVQRRLAEDVYVTPLAFRTSQGWVGADAAGTAKATPEGLDAVTFTFATLPLMSLVWAGLWMGVAGMVLVLAGAALLRGKDARRTNR